MKEAVYPERITRQRQNDKMFKSYVDMGAFGKFLHIPKPTSIDQ